MILYRRFSKLQLYKYFWLIFSLVLIIYNEYLTYYLNTWNWHSLHCEKDNKCTKILLVGDPQIIGNTQETHHYLTPFSIFDIDRYLYKTYTQAFNFVQPDLVIFLGDLTDEGHIATNEEFYQYVRRIFDIFLTDRFEPKTVRYIWLPGDNDIGGEDSEINDEKIKRFRRSFSQPDMMTVNNITYFKINRMTMDIPVYKGTREFYDSSKLFIGLSHVPLMFKPSPFVNKVITKMLPQLIFTAHEHKSMIINTDALLREEFHITPVTPNNNQVFEYSLGINNMYEILIPTCSYRMGTNKIGYGYAIIENNDLRFTVLWSPSRFDQLHNYLYFFIIFLLCTAVVVFYVKCTYMRICDTIQRNEFGFNCRENIIFMPKMPLMPNLNHGISASKLRDYQNIFFTLLKLF